MPEKQSAGDKPVQVKSRERVQKHGEVFTAVREVNAMVNLAKNETDRIGSRFSSIPDQSNCPPPSGFRDTVIPCVLCPLARNFIPVTSFIIRHAMPRVSSIASKYYLDIFRRKIPFYLHISEKSSNFAQNLQIGTTVERRSSDSQATVVHKN